MRYVTRTVLGMGLFAFCWVLIGYGIFQLLQVGTCASGGPYVSARECPPGIERLMFALVGGILGLFVAAFVYGGRGNPPGSKRPANNGWVIVWFWTGLFWSLAVGCFLGVWGPDANPGPGGKAGGLIVGFMGLFMGLGGFLAVGFRDRRGSARLAPAAAGMARAATRFAPVSSAAEQLATLERLRGQGTLTDAEFEKLKKRIVEGA